MAHAAAASTLVLLIAAGALAARQQQQSKALEQALAYAENLTTPDLTPYDPIELLCGEVKNGWCRDWVLCIKAGGAPAGDAASVTAAWGPATCQATCAPIVPPPAPTAPPAPPAANETEPPANATEPVGNSSLLQAVVDANGAVTEVRTVRETTLEALLGSKVGGDEKTCEDSCASFQANLASCVATIIFEPGKVASMMAPDAPAAPAICTQKESPCLPGLEAEYQSCLSKEPHKSYENCDSLKTLVTDTCKDCPQVAGGYVSQYMAFVGGCHDQLTAYQAATHPKAMAAALPDATGCPAH